MPRPLCSLSLDLDNLWSYLKTHGEAGWDEYPSYLDIVVPRVLKFLDDRKLKITWFIVGKDADEPKHHPVLRQITAVGTRSATTRTTTSRGCICIPKPRSMRSWPRPKTPSNGPPGRGRTCSVAPASATRRPC